MTNDAYVPVSEVAERLGLPLGILMRRVEAGDVPARKIDGPTGTRYELRLSDLGIEINDAGLSASVPATAVAEREPMPVTVGSIELTGRADSPTADAAPPPPRAGEPAEMALFDYPRTGPLAEIAAMTLDPRELVAGLLDRWERTLEQRIYAEQRQRFEAELAARQNTVRELQMELRAARAEHAAAQSEQERRLSERERALKDLQRDLAEQRAQSERTRKRGWLFRR